ncbi:MAG TPA: CoA-binding protein [Candidatus Binatia bacterium]|nr:CoA-binding protein [Candidatus Binatia bacterium]
MTRPTATDRFRPLFEPAGIVVAGVSSHPGKFGFVAAHNILSHGYAGPVFLTNRDGSEVLGRATLRSADEVPDGAADLVFVCTPADAVPELLRTCARKGVKAAFVSSAGYGEASPEGKRAERELAALAGELGILLAGPNGQGIISTPASLCAQIIAPYPPRGRIAIASQSGGFVQAFLNYARSTGVGVSRAVSAGNSAATSVADYLEYFAEDPETDVSLIYVEGLGDGRAFYEKVRAVAARKPLVVLKGGVTAGGQRAAASHTGALASDDRIFDGMCRQAGLTRAGTIDEAFEAAATFVTQPLPAGPNVFVLTTAGGWGVITADRVSASPVLRLMPLPRDLEAAFDARLPPRWSRNNPADLAGSETRDTVVECLELVTAHPEVHAVILLGVGIQSNLADLERRGRFYPGHGLERVVEYHERQDRRYAEAAVELRRRFGKPVLVATELADTQPDNPGPARLRELGGLAYPSSHRAVAALEHLYRYARFRTRAAKAATR